MSLELTIHVFLNHNAVKLRRCESIRLPHTKWVIIDDCRVSTQAETNAIFCSFVRPFRPISHNLGTRRKTNALHTKILKEQINCHQQDSNLVCSCHINEGESSNGDPKSQWQWRADSLYSLYLTEDVTLDADVHRLSLRLLCPIQTVLASFIWGHKAMPCIQFNAI